jgi:glutamyl-tRNA reductase
VHRTVERLKIIAFTHKSTDVNNLGRFFLGEDEQQQRLMEIKERTGIHEIVYLATCNRIEFIFCTGEPLSRDFLFTFYKAFNSSWTASDIEWNISHSTMFHGAQALEHIFNVAASLDSLVVGEREIIGQIRKAFERCYEMGLTGDFMRLVNKAMVKAAKEVFTGTRIAEKSVSVVFLAYQMLRNLNVRLDARFLIIGSGQTNATMAKYLLKHGFGNFTVFNRTLSNAEKLASELKGTAYPLSELENYREGFEVIISCTGSSEPLITCDLYKKLTGTDSSRKVIIDLAVPNDIEEAVTENFNVHHIAIAKLKAIAQENLQSREKEMEHAREIISENIEEFGQMLRHRKVELAMQEVPRKIREIKHNALNTVFAKDLEKLDDSSREVLEKVLSYMEKKYISVPMVMAKEIIIGKE